MGFADPHRSRRAFAGKVGLSRSPCQSIPIQISSLGYTAATSRTKERLWGAKFHAKHCGKKPFSLIFSCKMPADHWTFAVYQYTITSCVRDLSQIHGRTPGPPGKGSPVPVTSRPWWPVWPPKAGTLSFTLTPCLFRSPSAHPLCFPRQFRVHPARRRQGPIWRVYLQGLTRFRMISIRSRWRSSPRVFREAGV